MPWRGPDEPGEFPTLGYLVADWIEANCVVPDRGAAGEPFLLYDEQLLFLLWHYRLRPDAKRNLEQSSAAFHFQRGSQLVRPQKWGKGPLAAAMICAEAHGPVLFDGWDSDGEPVGRPWDTPEIQVTAVAEDQTDNVWRVLVPMIELGDLGAEIPDTGETRINLSNGGLIKPTTAAARSRLGQRITFAVQDQTESWLKRNGGIELAHNQRRNIAGMGGRWIETPNAWNPAENSVAQQTNESGSAHVHVDYPDPLPGSFKNKRERRRCLKHAYGDSITERGGHVDIDRIDVEVEDLVKIDEPQAERWFGNRVKAAADAWFALDTIRRLERPKTTIEPGDRVTLGFDGARHHDSTALVACRISDGHLQTLGVWERPPEDEIPDGEWEVDAAAVDAAVHHAFDTWSVVRSYMDPPWWNDDIDRWAGIWGQAIVRWATYRERAMAAALERFHTAGMTGTLTWSGDERLAEHVGNAVKFDKGNSTLIRKRHPQAIEKIDAAMAAVLAYQARGDVVASDVPADDEPAELIMF